MRLVGVGAASAEEVALDASRFATLLAAAPAGAVVVATSNAGAFIRALLGAIAAGRTVVPLDPNGSEPLPVGVAFVVIDPDAASRRSLAVGPTVRVVQPRARPSAWQRLMGGAPAPSASFPACLDALEPAPASPPAATQLRWQGAGGVWQELSAAEVAERVDLAARELGVGASSRLLPIFSLHHPHNLLYGILLAESRSAAIVVPTSGAVAAALDSVWRDEVSHLISTAGWLADLTRAGEDLREVFRTPCFSALVATHPLPPAGRERLEALTGRPVRELATEAAGEPELTATPELRVYDQVLAVAARTFREPASRLGAHTRAGDVPAWNSLGHLELIVALERTFDLSLSAQELAEVRTLGDLAACLERRVG